MNASKHTWKAVITLTILGAAVYTSSLAMAQTQPPSQQETIQPQQTPIGPQQTRSQSQQTPATPMYRRQGRMTSTCPCSEPGATTRQQRMQQPSRQRDGAQTSQDNSSTSEEEVQGDDPRWFHEYSSTPDPSGRP